MVATGDVGICVIGDNIGGGGCDDDDEEDNGGGGGAGGSGGGGDGVSDNGTCDESG